MIFKMKKILIVVPFLFFIINFCSSIFCFAETVQQKQEIYLNHTADNQPYQFEENGNLSGFEVELTEILFNNSDYKVKYDDNDNKNSLSISYGTRIVSSEETAEKSNAIYSQIYGLFTIRGDQKLSLNSKNIRNMKIGVLKKDFSYFKLRQLGITPVVYSKTTDGISDLINKKIDAWFGEAYNTDYFIEKENYKGKIDYHSELLYYEPIYMFIPKGNSELVTFVNSRIDKIKGSGELENIYVKYFFNHSHEYQDTLNNFNYIKLICILILIFIIVSLFAFRRLKAIIEKNEFSKSITNSILNHGNRFVVLWKTDLSYYEINSFFKNTFGLKNEVMPPELLKCLGEDFSEIIKSGELESVINSDNILTKSKDANDEIREIMWTSILISTKGNVKTILSIGSDMTEKNRLKRELKLSDERYQIALESADIAMIFIERDGTVPYLSDVGYRLMGMNISNALDIQSLLHRIHPSDREIYASNILGCTDNNKQFSVCEVRILGKNDEFRWFAFKFKLINNPTTGDPCIAGAFYDINDDKEKDLMIEKLAFEDDLTGIYNRQKFLRIVKETLINAKFNSMRYAVLTFNLNKFHRFNDLYGVEAGDRILKKVADILKYNPYGRDCTVARLGNDEFACLIRLENKEEHLEQYVSDISDRIQQYTAEQYDEIKLTISAGACIYPDNVSDFHEVYERSIFSMRTAKANPNGSYQIYDSKIKELILKREIFEKELIDAVEKKQFELYYQPKVDISSEKIVGAEALIRWNHPVRGVVSPVEFIPIAEEIGIINEIGKWTLETACIQNKIWQDQGLTNIKVSVNISSIEFYQTDIVGAVKTTLQKTGLDPKWLEIELTESMALVDVEETILKMNALKEIGVGISMDDFGTGYSSLSYIQNLPIDELKLDKSFINKITLDETTKNIIHAIINLAKIIGLVVVAEGVEEREQFNLLKEMNCNQIQGYLFSKPLKSNEIISMM